MNIRDIVKAYDSLGSIKEVAYKCDISTAKVKKILITEGVYENENSRKIKELYEAGKRVQEIAEILGISRSCVHMYIPYKKGVYGSDNPTDNAMRIRKCRKKEILS